MKKTFVDTILFPEMEVPAQAKPAHQVWKIVRVCLLAAIVVGIIVFFLAVTGEGIVPVSR